MALLRSKRSQGSSSGQSVSTTTATFAVAVAGLVSALLCSRVSHRLGAKRVSATLSARSTGFRAVASVAHILALPLGSAQPLHLSATAAYVSAPFMWFDAVTLETAVLLLAFLGFIVSCLLPFVPSSAVAADTSESVAVCRGPQRTPEGGLHHIDTADNLADLFTKTLDIETYRKHRNTLLRKTSAKIKTKFLAALKATGDTFKNMKKRVTMPVL